MSQGCLALLGMLAHACDPARLAPTLCFVTKTAEFNASHDFALLVDQGPPAVPIVWHINQGPLQGWGLLEGYRVVQLLGLKIV
jgi:hypothetical protein